MYTFWLYSSKNLAIRKVTITLKKEANIDTVNRPNLDNITFPIFKFKQRAYEITTQKNVEEHSNASRVILFSLAILLISLEVYPIKLKTNSKKICKKITVILKLSNPFSCIVSAGKTTLTILIDTRTLIIGARKGKTANTTNKNIATTLENLFINRLLF